MIHPFDAEVLREFLSYLSERHLIWERREKGQPGPWTTDPILSVYKFTNVLRSRDRTTRWLVKNWYEPNREQPPEVQALNCAIARYFGRVEFLEDLGYQKSWEPQYILETAKRRFDEQKSVFTGAYIITNQGMTDPKEEIVVNCFLSPYRMALPRLVEIAQRTQSWQSVAEGMVGLPGMGAFMTKEILLDWMLTPLLEGAHDRHTWTPAGPGAIRGLRRLLGAKGQVDVNKGMTQAEALRLMKILMTEIAEAQTEGRMPESFPLVGRQFGVTDVQFSLCELDKYLRVKLGEGRPRSLFKPFREKVS